MSQSALYEGTIRHRRFAVRAHEFRYRIAMAYLDLDELPDAARRAARRARAPGSCASAAATTSATRPCRSPTRCARWSPSALGARARRARSACSPTCARFGHCFNPVSFYYCFAADGERLEAVVAEVTNTPWGERHAYVLGAGDGR